MDWEKNSLVQTRNASGEQMHEVIGTQDHFSCVAHGIVTNTPLSSSEEWDSWVYDIENTRFQVSEVWNKAERIVRLKEEWFLVPKTYIIPHKRALSQPRRINLDNISVWPPWIVRSSCIEEDKAGASNAWRFKSIVVTWNKEELLEAVEQVIGHALALNATPSVIIQEYIEGSNYGVAFSRFLLDNNAYLPVAEYSSKAEAVTWGVESIRRHCFLWGDEELELPMPDDFLPRLQPILKRVELTFGTTQDIEYVVKDGEIYLLQSRDCVNTSNNSKWWSWTSRQKTPIFPCLFRTKITWTYQSKYDSHNQYILVSKWWITHLFYNKSDIQSFQENWIDGIKDSKNQTEEREKDFRKRLSRLISFARGLIENTDFDSNDSILKNIEQYEELYSLCVEISNEAFLWWFVLEKYLRSWLDARTESLELNSTGFQVFNILTESKRPSWSQILRRNIAIFAKILPDELISLVRENNLDEFSESIQRDPSLADRWSQIFEKYKWLWFNWIWPGLTQNAMFDVLRSIVNNSSIERAEETQDKDELFGKLWISEKDQYLFDLLGYFIHLKDWRNGMYSISAYHFFQWLIRLSDSRGIKVESLYDMSLKEVKDMIKTGKWNITQQEVKDMTLWTNTNGAELILRDKEAEDYMKTQNISLEEEFDANADVLKWESVCGWLVKWRAKFLSHDSWTTYGKDDIIIATSVHPTETGIIASVWGIIVEEWGITSHISIMARENWIPCIINLRNACKIIQEGEEITLDANKGCVFRQKN